MSSSVSAAVSGAAARSAAGVLVIGSVTGLAVGLALTGCSSGESSSPSSLSSSGATLRPTGTPANKPSPGSSTGSSTTAASPSASPRAFTVDYEVQLSDRGIAATGRTLLLTNIGKRSDKYTIVLEPPTAGTIRPEHAELAPGVSKPVTVSVSVPAKVKVISAGRNAAAAVASVSP